MVRLIFLSAVAALAPHVEGHWRFVRLAHNSVWKAPFAFIRNVTAPFTETYSPPEGPRPDPLRIYDPGYYPDLPNSVRCGRGNMDHAAETDVLRIKAGDTIEFVSAGLQTYQEFEDNRYWNDCPEGRGFCSYFGTQGDRPMKIIHPGPLSVYLSGVPSGKKVAEYDGSGKWTKIYTAGVYVHDGEQYWIANNKTGLNTSGLPPRLPVVVPKQTPAGEYLLRIDVVYHHYSNEVPQLYPACAQIVVDGDAMEALPEGGVQFPEAYDPKEPGMTLHQTWRVEEDYVYPGGDLWTGSEMVLDKPDLTPM